MRIAATLLFAAAANAQPGGPGDMPPCAAQAMPAVMGCFQENNIDPSTLAEGAPEGPPQGPADKEADAQWLCNGFKELQPCWSQFTHIADTCAEDELPPVGAPVGPQLVKHGIHTVMKCLPEICETGGPSQKLMAANRLVFKLVTKNMHARSVAKQLRRSRKAKAVAARQEETAYDMEEEMGPEGEDAENDVDTCLKPHAGPIVGCMIQNNVIVPGGPDGFQPNPDLIPGEPLTFADFCKIWGAAESCLPDVESAIDSCTSQIETKMQVPGELHPVHFVKCIFGGLGDLCPASGAQGRKVMPQARKALVPAVLRAMHMVKTPTNYAPMIAAAGVALVALLAFAVIQMAKPVKQQPEEVDTYGTV